MEPEGSNKLLLMKGALWFAVSGKLFSSFVLVVVGIPGRIEGLWEWQACTRSAAYPWHRIKAGIFITLALPARKKCFDLILEASCSMPSLEYDALMSSSSLKQPQCPTRKYIFI